MKREKSHKASGRLNNQGFSLVELVISIAVLVIIMVPLMNNFFRSMQMNKKAEKLQLQSNLAASIMEGLKASDMTELIGQFSGGGFNLITETIKGVDRLQLNTLSNKLELYDGSFVQDTYYFAINGIQPGGAAYDALITIDPEETYREDPGTMNRFPMPEVINLDPKANGLLFSNGTENGTVVPPSIDDMALTTFREWGTAYADLKFRQSSDYQSYLDAQREWQEDYVQAVLDGKTGSDLPVEPTEPTLSGYAATHPEYDEYMNEDKIKGYITKRMLVSVNDRNVTYDLEYSCAWPKGPGKLQSTGDNQVQSSFQNRIMDKNYPIAIRNVYLFYSPSSFQTPTHSADRIEVTSIDPLNFFVAQQETVFNSISIMKSGEVTLFTDLNPINYTTPEPESVIPGVVKTREEDRLFNVTINICKYEEVDVSNRYDMVLYTLESTMEQ